MKLTRAELDAMPAKTKKHPEIIDLYLTHNFIDAYAMHTDWRVERDGYKAAVGSADDWERHGTLQFEFLKQQGVSPYHRVLEIGCGTGRLARKLVPYLHPGRYTGVDISAGAIDAAQALADSEGWSKNRPWWVCGTDWPLSQADFIWCFSVFIHLPVTTMAQTMMMAAHRMTESSRFFFSFVPEKKQQRTGLKQFRHTIETYQEASAYAGLTFEECKQWKGEQHMAVARLA